MVTIRDLFHKIGNLHNKISISSGVIREEIRRKSFKDLSIDELKERERVLISSLDGLEKAAMEADSLLNRLRDVVYELGYADKPIGAVKRGE